MEGLIRADGYVNATKLCQSGGKFLSNWIQNKKTKEYLNILSSNIDIPVSKLIQKLLDYKSCKNGERHTWVHPHVATNIAQWISVNFAVKVSIWIDEWKQTNVSNTEKYETELVSIVANSNNQDERKIQQRLQSELHGDIEVKTKFGYIDLLTDTELIEIKLYDKWKHGVGQLCVYSKFYPNHKCRLHLFGYDDIDTSIDKMCEELNILVTYEPI